jgi:hypothetical protein
MHRHGTYTRTLSLVAAANQRLHKPPRLVIRRCKHDTSAVRIWMNARDAQTRNEDDIEFGFNRINGQGMRGNM